MNRPAGSCRTKLLFGTVSGETLREKYIDIPKFGAMCAQCPNYGKIWTCPPYDFDPMEIWDRCEEAQLVALQIFPETPEDRASTRGPERPVRRKLMNPLSTRAS